MAKQSSFIKFSGDIGGITFFERAGKFFAREKTVVDTEKLKTVASMERTRENNAEFTRAANAAKALRDAFRNITVDSSDSNSYNRLFSVMMRALKADTVNDRGKRTVTDGELQFVKGYDFNSAAELTAVLKAQFVSAIDRAGGTVGISVPPFVPARMINAPDGATHFRLIAAGAEVDFITGEYLANTTTSAELELDNNEVTVPALESLITPASTQPLFLAFGIEFVQLVNKKFYSLKNGTFNSISIVAVNTPQ